jgi:hypothetical protein
MKTETAANKVLRIVLPLESEGRLTCAPALNVANRGRLRQLAIFRSAVAVAPRPQLTTRRFPPPWSVFNPDMKLGQDCYIVHAADGQAYVWRNAWQLEVSPAMHL